MSQDRVFNCVVALQENTRSCISFSQTEKKYSRFSELLKKKKNHHKIIESINCSVRTYFHIVQLFLGILTGRVSTNHASVSLDLENFINAKMPVNASLPNP